MANKTSDWQPGPSVCRCCFAEGCYKDISTEYFWMGKREVYSEMLGETFDLSIAYSKSGGPNSNSRLICEPCISRLRDATDFKRQVQECERIFQQHLDPVAAAEASMQQDIETLDSPLKEEKLRDVKVEIEVKHSDDDDFDNLGFPDDDDDDDMDDQPLTKLASKVPKKESLDLMELLDNSAKPEKRKSTTKVKVSPAKKVKKQKEVVQKPQPSVSKAQPPPKAEKKKKDLPDDAAVKNAIVILNHSTAYPFQPSKKSFRCCFCSKETSEFDEPDLFRQHMDTAHNDIDKSSCFKHPDKGMTRVDITNLKCKKSSCKDTFDSLKDMANHLNSVHGHEIDLSESLGLVPLRLEKDRFNCVICSKTYLTLSHLSKHTGTHFYKNICHKCGANFETQRGLERHIFFSHSSQKFLCQTCRKSFPDLASKKAHVRSNKKCQAFRCKVCKDRFLCMEAVNQHMAQVHGKAKDTYPCPECSEVFLNRTVRYFHFKKEHTDDFKCSYCSLKFSTSRSFEDHVARAHTFERKYCCEVCNKSFISPRFLSRHLWIHDEKKRHACSACDKSYTIKTRLKQHVKKDHPDIYPDLFPSLT